MLPIFIINLPSDKNRLDNLKSQTLKLGLEFTRIDAVDGGKLSANELSSLRSEGPWGLIGAKELGCFLSHRAAWRAIDESPHQWGVVLEDDVHLSSELNNFLTDISWIPADADLIKIEAYPDKKFTYTKFPKKIKGRKLYKLKSFLMGAGGYLISKRFCKRIFAMESLVNMPVDNFLFDINSPLFQQSIIYALEPALVIQDLFLEKNHSKFKNFDSNLYEDRKNRFYKEKILFKTKIGVLGREINRIKKRIKIYLINNILNSRKNGIRWRLDEF